MIDSEQHPFDETSEFQKSAAPCVLVIFGATGDLTARKLVPALYNLAREGLLPAHFACIGFARRPKDHEIFRKEMLEAVNEHSRVKPVDPDLWKTFSESLFYHRSEFNNDEGYDSLRAFCDEIDQKNGTKGNRVFYLSTPPKHFPTICEKLHQHKLIYSHRNKEKCSRVIIEKPFGHDSQSATKLQKQLEKYLHESQIYRIDHYLGKETVQNLMVFRFSNGIFESIWNNHHVDHVQITVSEDMGIGTRGHFFEEAGMLRDIVQNHIMQLLCLVAMEPPVNLKPDSIHDEKVKVLEAIRPLPVDAIDRYAIRGQYDSGFIEGNPVKGYRDEPDVSSDSSIETYVALELSIDNWRWSGVPFYVRAGKRLAKRTTEIAVVFKKAPGVLFSSRDGAYHTNVLTIRIQPNEGISLKMNCKVPGLNQPIQPVKMDFNYNAYFGLTPPEAYERLICDCMAGDNTLFARKDEVMASWNLLTPILTHWNKTKVKNFPNYASGSWGPEDAHELMARGGRKWRLL